MTSAVHIPPTPFRDAVARLVSSSSLAEVAVVETGIYGTDVRPLCPWQSFTLQQAVLWNVLHGLAAMTNHLEHATREADERDLTALFAAFAAIESTGRPVAIHKGQQP